MISRDIVYFGIASVYLYATLREYYRHSRHGRYDWAEISCYGCNAVLHGLLAFAVAGH